MNQESFASPGRPDQAMPGRYRLASEATHGVVSAALAVGSSGRAPGSWWNPSSDESTKLRGLLRIATALERIATALEGLASDADQTPQVQDLTDQLQASGVGLQAAMDAASPPNP